jgi:aminoglycoside phosphotransferase (APT) family kinase protein
LIEQPQEIELLLRSILGAQTRLVECQAVKRQQDYRVLLGRLSHPDMQVVVKLAGPEARMASQFDQTAAIHRLVAQSTTIPIPEVIAVDVTLRNWPWRYLIRSFVPGEEWAVLRKNLDQAELASAYRQIGDAVGQLHRIEFPAFGEIDGHGQVVQPDTSCLAALRRRAVQIIQSPRLQETFLAAVEQRSGWFESVEYSGLCHEDLHGYNILFDRQGGEWGLTAVLDFEKAWAGSPETDLARLEIWRGMTSPDFWAAYRALRPLEEGYAQRRPLYQLLWCLEYADPAQEHLADTRRVCQELGIPNIESFD